MKYIVYLTTNKINGKQYIGVHETENPDVFDNYLGDGSFANRPSTYNKGKCLLHKAILKYGVSAFRRYTLRVFDNLDDALDLETWLVTDEYVSRTDTYNMTKGGGMPPRLNKKVYQFNLKGELIKEWESISLVNTTYKVNKDRMWMCIRDKRSFDNCFWSLTDSIDVSEYRLSANGYVYQYSKDGVLMEVFKSVEEASLKLDLERTSITNAVFGRYTLGGCYFLKAADDIYELINEKNTKINKAKSKIYKYDLNKKFVEEFNSVKEVESFINRSTLLKAIKNQKPSKGFYWSYEKDDYLPEYKGNPRDSIKIAQYDLNHNLIKIWDSVKECKKEFPCCQKVCRKQNRQTKGFIFEYIS